MNADILKRVVRAIAEGSQPDLLRLAQKMVESERKTGHSKLAAELEALLKARKPEARSNSGAPERSLHDLPLSRRHGDSLATLFPTQVLEHHMVLADAVERRFARIEAEYAARDRLHMLGLRARKTILLYGPPGNGKSLAAKRLAWNTGLPLMKVRFDALLSSYFGESAANLRAIFEAANQQPCVLLLDECDFIAKSRTAARDVGEASRIVNSLLQLMEEYDAPGLLVATTNIESSLDIALFRRFDDVFLVPPPGPLEIEKLLRSTLSAVRLQTPMDWASLVSMLRGFSAAMVVKAAQDAAKATVLAGKTVVDQAALLAAISEIQRNDTNTITK